MRAQGSVRLPFSVPARPAARLEFVGDPIAAYTERKAQWSDGTELPIDESSQRLATGVGRRTRRTCVAVGVGVSVEITSNDVRVSRGELPCRRIHASNHATKVARFVIAHCGLTGSQSSRRSRPSQLGVSEISRER